MQAFGKLFFEKNWGACHLSLGNTPRLFTKKNQQTENVPPLGLQPRTLALEVPYSMQLSYGGIYFHQGVFTPPHYSLYPSNYLLCNK